MGWRKKLFVLVALLFIINFLSSGRLLAFVLPDVDQAIGRFYCVAGGIIVNPFVTVGNLHIPIPQTDDFLVIGALTVFFSTYILKIKPTWRTWKRVIAIFLSTFSLFLTIYKVIGYYFIYVAEVQYGLTGCVEFVDIGIATIPFGIFTPLYILGLVLLVPGVIGAIYRLKKGKSDKQ